MGPVPANGAAAPTRVKLMSQVATNSVSNPKRNGLQWLGQAADEILVRIPEKIGPIEAIHCRAQHDAPRTGDVVGARQAHVTVESNGRTRGNCGKSTVAGADGR